MPIELPLLERLEAVFNLVESKYRSVKKQQETILDKLIEEGASSEIDLVLMNRRLEDNVKADFLQITLKFAAYQGKNASPKGPDHTETLKTMTSAVEKMAVAIGTKTSSLERLTVPNWDGSRRTYQTLKREFRHFMVKYGQDEDEQLQRFRKAIPKGFFWTDQVKTCKGINQAWEILETEFANTRKLMELLAEMNNLKHVKRDSKSLTRYATTISVFVNDMEDNGNGVRGSVLHVSAFIKARSKRQLKLWKRDAKSGERRKCVKPRNLVTSRGNPSLQRQTRQ